MDEDREFEVLRSFFLQSIHLKFKSQLNELGKKIQVSSMGDVESNERLRVINT